MVIKRSAREEIAALIRDLQADEEIRRDAAVARLAVIGPRAVTRLLATALPGTPARTRMAAFQALQAIGDPRAIEPALAALDDPDTSLAETASDVLRAFLFGDAGATVVDRLTAVAMDAGRNDRTRLAAVDALAQLPEATRQSLWLRLEQDPSEAVRARVTGVVDEHEAAALDVLEAWLAGSLPSDPAPVRDMVIESAASASLPVLHRMVGAIRDRERNESRAEQRAMWMVARGAVHRALAERDSRVALYDLRETVEGATAALPVDFVAALARIGDATCLEPVAAAYAAARTDDDWWRRHLAETFREIVRRERLTKRHQAVKRVLSRCPELSAVLPG